MPQLSPFAQKTHEALKRIPPGKVTTYAGLACAIGHPRSYRAVGNILNKNSLAPVVPCHRVIRSDGQIGGYNQGTDKKIKLLRQEGIKIKNNRVENIKKFLYYFK